MLAAFPLVVNLSLEMPARRCCESSQWPDCNTHPQDPSQSSGNWRSKFEITLSSPDVLAAEDFEQSNLIYDDSGEFDADISGMLCALP